MNQRNNRYDIGEIRKRLNESGGREYWRSLDELADTPEFQEFLHREFPENASEWTDGVNRRGFLKLMGASLALAGLSACTRQPVEKIVPYVRQPEEIVPGKPLFYATAIPISGYATGILVESHMGRPTKVEGNPEHPASLGATDVYAQAAILSMYDPDRSQAVIHRGNISSWSSFLEMARLRMGAVKNQPSPGSGFRILTETVTSPTQTAQILNLLKDLPAAKWHSFEPVNRDSFRAGARMAFGEPVDIQYRFDRADIVLSIESDFLCSGPGNLRYAREFMNRRRVREEDDTMNRLYCVESIPTTTGAVADHRWCLRPAELAALAADLAAMSSKHDWLSAVFRDLQQHRGSSIVIAGDHQPPEIHAAVHILNQALGNVGHTVFYTDPIEANAEPHMESLTALVADMNSGNVETLVILGGNPVYNSPADLNFAEALKKVGLRVHLSLYEDETSNLCHWHIPEAHFLESWSDARAYDGTASIIQPLIAPLYAGKTAHEVLSVLAGKPNQTDHDLVRAYWKEHATNGDFEKFWRKALHDGFIPDTALPSKAVTASGSPASTNPVPAEMELVLLPDPNVYDGRFANNGWLQELPKPLTKITWDNAAFVSPTTAERLGVQNEDEVNLQYGGRSVRAAAWVLPGLAPETVLVHLGYGRERAGNLGNGAGFNAFRIQTSKNPSRGTGVEIQRTGGHYPFAVTQNHHSMEGRPLVRSATLEGYREHPHFAHEMEHDPKPDESLYPRYPYEGHAWGMAIDLNACTGCNACVLACQSENNIPVVGKREVIRQREMHWIRIDRYYKGDLDNPETVHQPVLCMHCENAPCEVVCPANATVHSSEGLNDMVYNRCVGTRYCSNNCPYKVRRFNFYLYSDAKTPTLKMMKNPDVTVRTRGVMEKCTYCVQRINYAKIEAGKEDREVKEGEIVTACQQVCPAEAIVFGDINDPNSKVAKLKANSLNYGLLTSLNTHPRTSYLARLRNPNPELEKPGTNQTEHSSHSE